MEKIAGTPPTNVARSPASAVRKARGSYLGMSTTLAPAKRFGLIVPRIAFLWKRGTVTRPTSSGLVGQRSSVVRMLQSMPACVRRAPLGLPVDPAVYG